MKEAGPWLLAMRSGCWINSNKNLNSDKLNALFVWLRGKKVGMGEVFPLPLNVKIMVVGCEKYRFLKNQLL